PVKEEGCFPAQSGHPDLFSSSQQKKKVLLELELSGEPLSLNATLLKGGNWPRITQIAPGKARTFVRSPVNPARSLDSPVFPTSHVHKVTRFVFTSLRVQEVAVYLSLKICALTKLTMA
ncbi:hypothetical protein H1C71_028301, partial [Ictidomys tridecemlineatus]